ncbi:MAG: retroviral-like aspartic protease family protein [Candidatus Desantisbacteria bacterium]
MSKEIKKVRCILDTGAHRTTLPRDVIYGLGLISGTHELVKDYFGEERWRSIYMANISIEGYRFSEMKVLLTNSEVGLIGRDILNQWAILLDGKRKLFYIADKVKDFGSCGFLKSKNV